MSNPTIADKLDSLADHAVAVVSRALQDTSTRVMPVSIRTAIEVLKLLPADVRKRKLSQHEKLEAELKKFSRIED